MTYTFFLTALYGLAWQLKKRWRHRSSSLMVLIFLCTASSAQAQWQKVNALPNQLFTTLHSTGADLYAATFDRVFHSSDGGGTWQESAAIHTNNDDEVSALWVHDGTIYVGLLLDGCRVSTDGGQTWQALNAGLNGLGARSVTAFAQRGNYLYAATLGAGVFEKPLAQTQANWSSFDQNLPWGTVQSLTTDGNTLLAGAGPNSTVSRQVAGNPTWSEHVLAPFNGEVNFLLAARRDSQMLLGAGSQGLYRSTDNGLTWSGTGTGVGLVERARLAYWQGQNVVLMTKPSGSFLRTSLDQGLSWQPLQPALPAGALGYDLVVHQGQLFCARTNGLWVLSPTVGADEPTADRTALGQNFPNPVVQHLQTTVPFYLGRAGEVRLTWSNAQGQQVGAANLGWLTPGQHFQRIDLQGLPGGWYTYSLHLDTRVLTRRLLVLHSD